jgi:hypothetical protein
MEYLNHENIAYCTLFNLKLSQDELEVYESCMEFVLNRCSESEIYDITGCSIDELKDWQINIKKLILAYVEKENISEKYKDMK